MSNYYCATINAKFPCKSINLNKCDHYFKNIKWIYQIKNKNLIYNALIYYPLAETKLGHYQNDNVINLCQFTLRELTMEIS